MGSTGDRAASLMLGEAPNSYVGTYVLEARGRRPPVNPTPRPGYLITTIDSKRVAHRVARKRLAFEPQAA